MNVDFSLLPENWLNSKDWDIIYSSVYYCIGPWIYEWLNPIILSDILDVYFVIFEWEISYSKFIDDFDRESIVMKTEQCERKWVFIKFFSKWSSEHEALKKIEFIKWLLIISFWTQFCYWHILDEQINIKWNESSLIWPTIKTPNQIQESFSIKQVEEIKNKLSNLPGKKLNIITLALRWVCKSANEIDSIDEFLKLWFCIETIWMPWTADIKPLCIKLGNIYNTSFTEAKNRFYLWKINWLRSSIVHGELIPVIHTELLEFLRAIIFDLLYDELGIDWIFKADSILKNSRFPLDEWLPL